MTRMLRSMTELPVGDFRLSIDTVRSNSLRFGNKNRQSAYPFFPRFFLSSLSSLSFSRSSRFFLSSLDHLSRSSRLSPGGGRNESRSVSGRGLSTFVLGGAPGSDSTIFGVERSLASLGVSS